MHLLNIQLEKKNIQMLLVCLIYIFIIATFYNVICFSFYLLHVYWKLLQNCIYYFFKQNKYQDILARIIYTAFKD